MGGCWLSPWLSVECFGVLWAALGCLGGPARPLFGSSGSLRGPQGAPRGALGGPFLSPSVPSGAPRGQETDFGVSLVWLRGVKVAADPQKPMKKQRSPNRIFSIQKNDKKTEIVNVDFDL